MVLITDKYRELNVDLHRCDPGFGGGGYKWSSRVKRFMVHYRLRSVLDYGCGKGTLYRALTADYDVREYDPGIPGKDRSPGRADLVVCTDVLEHVEPDCLDDVIRDIVRLSKRMAMVAVACRKGRRVLADGRMDHLIVENMEWWHIRLNAIAKFEQVSARRSHEYAGIHFK